MLPDTQHRFSLASTALRIVNASACGYSWRLGKATARASSMRRARRSRTRGGGWGRVTRWPRRGVLRSRASGSRLVGRAASVGVRRVRRARTRGAREIPKSRPASSTVHTRRSSSGLPAAASFISSSIGLLPLLSAFAAVRRDSPIQRIFGARRRSVSSAESCALTSDKRSPLPKRDAGLHGLRPVQTGGAGGCAGGPRLVQTSVKAL